MGHSKGEVLVGHGDGEGLMGHSEGEVLVGHGDGKGLMGHSDYEGLMGTVNRRGTGLLSFVTATSVVPALICHMCAPPLPPLQLASLTPWPRPMRAARVPCGCGSCVTPRRRCQRTTKSWRTCTARGGKMWVC